MKAASINGSLFLQFMKGGQDVIHICRLGNRFDQFIHSITLLIICVSRKPIGNQCVHFLLGIQVAPTNLMRLNVATLLHSPERSISNV